MLRQMYTFVIFEGTKRLFTYSNYDEDTARERAAAFADAIQWMTGVRPNVRRAYR